MNISVRKNIMFNDKHGNVIYVDAICCVDKRIKYRRLLCFDFDDTLLKSGVDIVEWYIVSNDLTVRSDTLNRLELNGETEKIGALLKNAKNNQCGVAIVTFNDSIKSVVRTLEHWFGSELGGSVSIVAPSITGNYLGDCIERYNKRGIVEYVQSIYGVTDKEATVVVDDNKMNLNSVKDDCKIMHVDQQLTSEQLKSLSDYVVYGRLIDDSKLVEELRGIRQPIESRKRKNLTLGCGLTLDGLGDSNLVKRRRKRLSMDKPLCTTQSLQLGSSALNRGVVQDLGSKTSGKSEERSTVEPKTEVVDVDVVAVVGICDNLCSK